MIRSGHLDLPDHRVDVLRERGPATVELGDIVLSTGKRVTPVNKQDHAVADHLAFDQEQVEPRVGNAS